MNVLNSDHLLHVKDGSYTLHKYAPKPENNLYNYRSVITHCNSERGNVEEEVVCFSPPKSITFRDFLDLYSSKDIIVEEYIEGTMVNVFFVNGEWKIASRSKINADCFFFDTNGHFSNMAKESFIACCLDLTALNKDYCYSFVIQHPNNRIVTKFETMNVYLIVVYKIETTQDPNERQIREVCDIQNNPLWETTNIQFPAKILNFDLKTEHPYTRMGDITEQPYTHMGVVFKDPVSGARCKLRNPAYEYVRHLRGNQPKLMYRYLELRKIEKITEYLKYFPEHADKFALFQSKIHAYTSALYNLYVNTHILKQESPDKNAKRFKTSLFKLHEIYITQRVKINLSQVITFVNSLPEAVLMSII
jgi:hypothetical protein